MILTESFGKELADTLLGPAPKWYFPNTQIFQGGNQIHDQGLGAVSATVRDTRIETVGARVPGGRFLTMMNKPIQAGIPMLTRVLDADRSTVFMACAYNNSPPYVSDVSLYGFSTLNYDAQIMAAADRAGTTQVSMVGSGLNLQVYAGGSLRFTLSSSIVQARWHYLELGFKISPTAGWVEARLDGVLYGSYYGSTGTNRANANGNTMTAATPTVRRLSYGAPAQPFTGCFADILAMDDVALNPAQPNNNFLGDLQVVWNGAAGPGAHSDFVVGGTSPVATPWQSVIGAASYDVRNIEGFHAGDISTFAMDPLPAFTQKVYAVAPYAIGEKASAGARRGGVLLRWAGNGSGALDFPLQDVILQNAYVRLDGGILGVSLTGQPWAVDEVNALEIGVKVTS